MMRKRGVLFCKQLLHCVAVAAGGRVKSCQVVPGYVGLVVAFFLQSAQAGDTSRGSHPLTWRAKSRSDSDELQIGYTSKAPFFNLSWHVRENEIRKEATLTQSKEGDNYVKV